MNFSTLRIVGADTILKKAADIIDDRGLNRGSAIHSFTGQVDVWGAVCLAGGADPDEIDDDVTELDRYVPLASRGPVQAAYELVSLTVGDDASTWGDRRSEAEVSAMLRHLSNLISIS